MAPLAKKVPDPWFRWDVSTGAQEQAALTAVTEVMKEPVLFIPVIVYCFFTIGSVKFLQ